MICRSRSAQPAIRGCRARCLQALGTLGLKDSDPSACPLDAADTWHDLGDIDGEFYSAIYAAESRHAREGEAEMDVLARCRLAAATPDDADKQWVLETIRAEATWLLGYPEEALDPLLPWLERASPGSWNEFWVATRVADLELVLHRFESALAHYGVAMAALKPLGTPLGLLTQATTISPWPCCTWAESRMRPSPGRCASSVSTSSTWLPGGAQGEWFEAVRPAWRRIASPPVASARRNWGWTAAWSGSRAPPTADAAAG